MLELKFAGHSKHKCQNRGVSTKTTVVPKKIHSLLLVVDAKITGTPLYVSPQLYTSAEWDEMRTVRIRLSNIGNIILMCLMLTTMLASAANAQSGWYDGWTDQNAQAITDPFTGVSNQQFFGDSSSGPSLDDPFFKDTPADNVSAHPFFDDSAESFSPARNKSQTLKPMLGLEALYLSRSGLDDVDFVFDDNGPSLSYSDLDPGSDASVRFRAGLMDGRGQGFEYVSFDFDDFGRTQVVDGPNVLPVFFGGSPANAQPSWDITYTGEFSSHEINVWARTSDRFRCGLGARYMNLREDFNVVDSSQTTTGFFSDSDNDLFGAQWVGEYSHPISNTLEVVVGLKLGGFYNNVDSRFFAENVQFHLEDETFSFVTDLNVGLTHHISQSATFSLGYQLINLTDVAVAPNQSRSVQAFAPDSNDLDFDNALFNGAYAGVNVRF